MGNTIKRMESNYTFSHRFVNIHGDVGFDVRVRTSAETSTEIIQEFVDFLKGCQFCEGAILSGLENAVYELGGSLEHVEKTEEY